VVSPLRSRVAHVVAVGADLPPRLAQASLPRWQRSRAAAGWGCIALYLAVFPANLHMAINQVPFGGEPVEPWILWARLPLQLVFMGWAYAVTRPAADRP
jgi:uncharacterized membrane protein